MNAQTIIVIGKLGPWGGLAGLVIIAALCVTVLELLSRFFKINDAIKEINDMRTRIAAYGLELNSPLDYVYADHLTPGAREKLFELQRSYQKRMLSYKELRDKILESLELVYPKGTPGARATLYRWLRRGLRIDPEHNDDLRNLKSIQGTLLALGNEAKELERKDLEEKRNEQYQITHKKEKP